MDQAAASIELFVLDVDGVLTDGRVQLDADGREIKCFHVRDGLAMRAWIDLGLELAIVSGRRSPAVERRARELGVRHVHQGIGDKWPTVRTLAADLDIEHARIAVMGDDLPDLAPMRHCGLAIAPADAAPEVRSAADLVTTRPGGHAAVREAVEYLLRAQERWDQVVAARGG